MRLLISTVLLALLGCRPVPTPSGTVQPEAVTETVPVATDKISGTVISFEKHPSLDYQYVVLTFLDEDGMLRVEVLEGQGMHADLSLHNHEARRVHLGWIPREGDRFRMTRGAYGNYDLAKIEEM